MFTPHGGYNKVYCIVIYRLYILLFIMNSMYYSINIRVIRFVSYKIYQLLPKLLDFGEYHTI